MFGRFHDRAASGRRVLDLLGGAGQTSLVLPWSSDADHRVAARPRIAVRDLDGNFFVGAEQYRRIVFAVVDQGVVQAAVTRSRIKP
jgi:hypothetical protein